MSRSVGATNVPWKVAAILQSSWFYLPFNLLSRVSFNPPTCYILLPRIQPNKGKLAAPRNIDNFRAKTGAKDESTERDRTNAMTRVVQYVCLLRLLQCYSIMQQARSRCLPRQ